jgi:DNA modification methylase
VNGGLDKTGKGKDRIVERKPFGKRNNIWRFDTQKNTEHPAPFPEQLANDHIISWSNENDLIYDPFMGSGTTAKMAMLNNRKYIGSEISDKYCDMATNRIKKIKLGYFK